MQHAIMILSTVFGRCSKVVRTHRNLKMNKIHYLIINNFWNNSGQVYIKNNIPQLCTWQLHGNVSLHFISYKHGNHFEYSLLIKTINLFDTKRNTFFFTVTILFLMNHNYLWATIPNAFSTTRLALHRR